MGGRRWWCDVCGWGGDTSGIGWAWRWENKGQHGDGVCGGRVGWAGGMGWGVCVGGGGERRAVCVVACEGGWEWGREGGRKGGRRGGGEVACEGAAARAWVVAVVVACGG